MKNYLIDMDGVLVQGKKLIPGADTFIEKLRKQKREFLLLTNNPLYTPRDLAHRLQEIGINIEEERIFTSSMATASFLAETLHMRAIFSGAGLTLLIVGIWMVHLFHKTPTPESLVRTTPLFDDDNAVQPSNCKGAP